MNKPITINLFGGPGVGKSTLSTAIFSLLKMHGVNTELVTEFAKDLTWEERYRTLVNQYYIWGKQHHRMWRIKDQVDVMVTDAPLVLSLIYGENKPDCFGDMVLHSFNEFKNINYFLNRVKKFNPKGRYQTEEDAKVLDKKVISVLDKHNIHYEIIDGDYHGVNYIVNYILKQFGKSTQIVLNGSEE